MQNCTSIILYLKIICVAQWVFGANFEILHCSDVFARCQKLQTGKNFQANTCGFYFLWKWGHFSITSQLCYGPHTCTTFLSPEFFVNITIIFNILANFRQYYIFNHISQTNDVRSMETISAEITHFISFTIVQWYTLCKILIWLDFFPLLSQRTQTVHYLLISHAFPFNRL